MQNKNGEKCLIKKWKSEIFMRRLEDYKCIIASNLNADVKQGCNSWMKVRMRIPNMKYNRYLNFEFERNQPVQSATDTRDGLKEESIWLYNISFALLKYLPHNKRVERVTKTTNTYLFITPDSFTNIVIGNSTTAVCRIHELTSETKCYCYLLCIEYVLDKFKRS